LGLPAMPSGEKLVWNGNFQSLRIGLVFNLKSKTALPSSPRQEASMRRYKNRNLILGESATPSHSMVKYFPGLCDMSFYHWRGQTLALVTLGNKKHRFRQVKTLNFFSSLFFCTTSDLIKSLILISHLPDSLPI
jgi:hypothetical protein